MIVVDTNVIVYCWTHGRRTETAQRVRLRDPDWHVPVLWRSELCGVLSGYVRGGVLDLAAAGSIVAAAEAALAGREHLPSASAILELAAKTALPAYDCEFVALAEALSVPLVTDDPGLLDAFPGRAVAMEAFLRRVESEPPEAHAAGVGYPARRWPGLSAA